MGGFSFWHILIFALLVLLLFGGNRFSSMMGDIAKGLKSFKAGMADDEQANRPADPRQLPNDCLTDACLEVGLKRDFGLPAELQPVRPLFDR